MSCEKSDRSVTEMDLNPAFPVEELTFVGTYLWERRNINLEQPLGHSLRNGLPKILEAKVPAWVLWCTFFGTNHLIAIVDNEISAVECSERHISVCGEDHRPHMHFSALSETLLLRLDSGKGLDPDTNIYRVSKQQVLGNALANTH